MSPITIEQFKQSVIAFHRYLTREDLELPDQKKQAFKLLIAFCQFTIKQLNELEQLNELDGSDKLGDVKNCVLADKEKVYQEIAPLTIEGKLRKNSDTWVQTTWNNLKKTHETTYRGYIDYIAQQSQLSELKKCLPWPKEDYQPGQGERKYYYLWPEDKTQEADQSITKQLPAVHPSGMISYRRETVKKRDPVYRWFIRSSLLSVSGLLKWWVVVFWVPLAWVLLMCYLVWHLFPMGMLESVVSIGLIVFTLVMVQKSYAHYQVLKKRVVVAPMLINTVSDYYPDLLTYMKLSSAKPDQGAIICLIRYKSQCPVCGDVVGVIKGQNDLAGRLIGSCRRSPDEHVFSFDWSSQKGFPLRQTKQYIDHRQ